MCNLIALDPRVKLLELRLALEQTMRDRDDAPVFRLIERVRRESRKTGSRRSSAPRNEAP
jgi:hypothetical protein